MGTQFKKLGCAFVPLAGPLFPAKPDLQVIRAAVLNENVSQK
jgi:hypothetical protein